MDAQTTSPAAVSGASNALRRFYRFNAPIYDLTRWTILRGRGTAVGALRVGRGASVLDVGCGTGLNISYIEDAVGAEGDITAFDFSPEMLAVAERRCRRKGWRNVTLVEGDAAALDLGRQFDAVLFSFSIAMIPDWERSLERAATHLKPGGRMVLWDFGPFRRWVQPARGIARWWLQTNHVHLERPFAKSLSQWLPIEEDALAVGGAYVKVVARRPEA